MTIKTTKEIEAIVNDLEIQKQQSKVAGFRIWKKKTENPHLKCVGECNNLTMSRREELDLFESRAFQCPRCDRRVFIHRSNPNAPWRDVGHTWPALNQAAKHTKSLTTKSLFAGCILLLLGILLDWNPPYRIGGAVILFGLFTTLPAIIATGINALFPERPTFNSVRDTCLRIIKGTALVSIYGILLLIANLAIIAPNPARFIDNAVFPYRIAGFYISIIAMLCTSLEIVSWITNIRRWHDTESACIRRKYKTSETGKTNAKVININSRR